LKYAHTGVWIPEVKYIYFNKVRNLRTNHNSEFFLQEKNGKGTYNYVVHDRTV